MGRRNDLHDILLKIVPNVYFQPPETIKIQYPCIIYSRSDINSINANDNNYRNVVCYMVMVVDKNPDSLIPEKVLKLPLCKYDRHYKVDNLNHDVFNIYY